MLSELERQQARSALKTAEEKQQIPEVLLYAGQLARSGKAGDIMFCASAFKRLETALLTQGVCLRVDTYLVRSVTLEPLLPSIFVEGVLAGYLLDVKVGGYGSYMDDMLNPESELGRSDVDLILVVLDLEDISGKLPDLCASGNERDVDAELRESIGRVSQMLQSYRERCRGRLLIQGCVVPTATSLGFVAEANLEYGLVNTVKKFNRQLLTLCRTISDCVFFDVDEVAAQYGRAQWTDARMFQASRLPVAVGAFASYAQHLVRTLSVLFRTSRKVLCTDLDNTFWGGILGEDGTDGITTGNSFPGNSYFQYQNYLKQLASRGVLLAIVSKNNESDVEEAFNLRAADLGLGLDSFAGRKIGWGEKVESLKALAKELSLGLDSFVFVDDNPMECEAVRQQLPEVAVVAVPVDRPWDLVSLLAKESFFDVLTITADDLNRANEYKAQEQRSALQRSIPSTGDFLQSLEIVCTFLNATTAPLVRSVQLLSKTNQFNLTTRRHTASDVERFATSPGGQAIAVRVRDRFGDAGVVGLALARQEGESCVIDSLLLSCRVIGRGIESALLAAVASRAVHAGSRWLIGEYVPTNKNTPCANFYTKHGFQPDPTPALDGVLRYRLDLSAAVPASPVWLTLEGDPTHELSDRTLVAS